MPFKPKPRPTPAGKPDPGNPDNKTWNNHKDMSTCTGPCRGEGTYIDEKGKRRDCGDCGGSGLK